MRSLLPILFAATTLLGACASDPAPENVASAKDAQICTRETPVGSNFPVTKCRTPEQIAQEKAEADRVKSQIQQTTTFRPSE